MMISGLVSVSFRPNTPCEIIKAMAQAGVTAVEWGSDIHAPCNEHEKLKSIVFMQEQYGIRTASYGTYFRIGRDTPSNIHSYIEAARLLKTGILRLWCGDKDSHLYTEREKAALLCDCKTLAAIAQKEGVTLCMEYHPNTFTNTWESALWLMEKVNSTAFRMYWQPNQWASNEDNILSLKKLSPYVINLHVFNWNKEKHLPLEGAKDIWKRYFDIAPNAKYALLEFMPDNKIESLAKESKTLSKILNNN